MKRILLVTIFLLIKNILIFTQDLDSLVNNVVTISLEHIERSIVEIKDTNLFPTYGTKDLKWKLDSADQWTSGFYPGCLWYGYKLSGDTQFVTRAKQWTAALEPEKTDKTTHDLGFKFMCSYGQGLDIVTGTEHELYKSILLTAANTLAQRYNQKVGCVESNWDNKKFANSFPVIVDVMMNLELLLWASENGGQACWKDWAVNHAIKTYKDFVRPDGGTWHIVRYDSINGDIINKGTIQGQGDETTWARGQAWGVYGMVVMYRYTHDTLFLSYAEKLADYFISHLERDQVSRWDFQSEINYRDASATCVVASALFELVDYIPDNTLRTYYFIQAKKMLTALCNKPYFLGGETTSCLLDHSVHYLPINSNVDVPSSFADYYFLEALYRYRIAR